ncbi:4Fe-4S ferredoxin [bacterium]|nr:MAG: 4Fe-4S ferredoxin [bacterium]
MADKIVENIRKEAKRILEEKIVDIVIGFEKGTLPYTASPVFIENPDDVDKLIWNRYCHNNLAVYLRNFPDKKIGIIVKGCDSRSIVALMAEKQLTRENIYIIGVPCEGMLDKNKLLEEFGDNPPAEVKEEFLYPSCQYCEHKNPVIYDFLTGEPVQEKEEEPYPDVVEFEKKTLDERWKYFQEEASKCIRCYACRQACPMCYCEECFVDTNSPKWLDPGIDLPDLQVWHIIRAYHQAGRCVDCGACERACPMDIKILWLTRKLNKDVRDLFEFEIGIDPEKVPPLGTFSLYDKEEFLI